MTWVPPSKRKPSRADRPGDTQGLPTPNDRESIHDMMVEDAKSMFGQKTPAVLLIAERAEKRKALGIERYGTPLQAFNGRRAVVDALEEAHDLAVYLRQWVEEIEELGGTDTSDWTDAWGSYEQVMQVLFTLTEVHAGLPA